MQGITVSILLFWPRMSPVNQTSSSEHWQAIENAPFDRNLELALIDRDGLHKVVFACRRTPGGWVNAKTRQPTDVHPTHWREWQGIAY
ncbi:MAG: hypothetical protein WAW96_07710 [Alphaproteobacteria bacterium]